MLSLLMHLLHHLAKIQLSGNAASCFHVQLPHFHVCEKVHACKVSKGGCQMIMITVVG